MNSFEKLQLKVILEKLIVGLEEPILIKSVGKMIAKIDSGNGGYNVIHGENLYYQGDVLTFETSDINGNRKVVSKKVKDTIKINIGGGNIQERPVIELNIKFAGEDYKKIPFSVTDRSTNDQKVLISKDFLVNQLNALIDPSTKDIANKNIDVDYPLNEGSTSILKKSHNFIKKWGELSNVDTSFMYQYQDTFTGIANLLKTALGFGKEVPILNQFGVPKNVKSKLSNFDSYIKKYDSTVSSISSAASSFVYKAKGKTNESLIFEDEKTEEAILNVTEATVKKNYESAFLKAVESDKSYITIKDNIDNRIKQIKAGPENILELKEELKNEEINLEKTKNIIIEKNYNNNEFIINAINNFIQTDKDRYIRAFEKKKEDVIKIFEELKNNFNNNLDSRIKEIEQNHKISVNQITNEKILKNRGNFKVYFEADRRYKTEVDSNDYIKEFIFHLLNTNPESFEKIAKEFYASRDINKKWSVEEIGELLKPGVEKLKNGIIEHNNDIKGEDSSKPLIAGKFIIEDEKGEKKLLAEVNKDDSVTSHNKDEEEGVSTEEDFFKELISDINRKFNDAFTTSDLDLKFSIAGNKSVYEILYVLVDKNYIDQLEGMDNKEYENLLNHIKNEK